MTQHVIKEKRTKVEINDEIVKKCQLDEKETLEFLAVALYKRKGIRASLAGEIVGLTKFEFHSGPSKNRWT